MEAIGNLVTSLYVEKLQRKLQNKDNGNLERELSELYEILLSVSRMPYGKERKASSIREKKYCGGWKETCGWEK